MNVVALAHNITDEREVYLDEPIDYNIQIYSSKSSLASFSFACLIKLLSKSGFVLLSNFDGVKVSVLELKPKIGASCQ
jgi:hypothetical protein